MEYLTKQQAIFLLADEDSEYKNKILKIYDEHGQEGSQRIDDLIGILTFKEILSMKKNKNTV